MRKTEKPHPEMRTKIYNDLKSGELDSSAVGAFKVDANLLKKHFPDSPWILVSDVHEILAKAVAQMLSTSPPNSVVMLDREKVKALVFSTVSMQTHHVVSELRDDLAVARRKLSKEMMVAADEVRKILNQTKNGNFSYEDFESKINETSSAAMSREVLRRFGNHPLTIQTVFGPINFDLDPEVPHYLPSKDAYLVSVSVSVGYSESEKCAFVLLGNVFGRAPSFLKKGERYKLAAGHQSFRNELIDAQRNNRMLDVYVRIPRLPIFPKSKKQPQLVLVDIVSQHGCVPPAMQQLSIDMGKR